MALACSYAPRQKKNNAVGDREKYDTLMHGGARECGTRGLAMRFQFVVGTWLL